MEKEIFYTEVKTFEELNTHELYELLWLRSEVFVVEQQCVYQDLDYKDQKALHILGKKGSKLVAYTRVFDANDYFSKASIGRVLVSKKHRTDGFGNQILKASIAVIEQTFQRTQILISAQKYLIGFYQTHGFREIGEEYLEDGIPHIKMLRD